ncbi:substrate-binding domain-containing protein, partial [Rhodanobacter sp. 115]|uniref:substrate-binding domain-containing protein n=1 Tax=Rhodanobacter sp. FW021-MT20 TaxID=1162282 RepID=UPI0034E4E99F
SAKRALSTASEARSPSCQPHQTRESPIFAANDDMACGVMREAHERGLVIPRDLSVCGFDGTPVSQLISPGLTTVHQPCREMGCAATERVLQAIRDPALRKQERVPYQVQLRASTAAPGKP